MAADGEIYVADGYGHARILRFDPGGQLVASFGDVGRGPGAVMTPTRSWSTGATASSPSTGRAAGSGPGRGSAARWICARWRMARSW